jgi:hypothetical protein
MGVVCGGEEPKHENELLINPDLEMSSLVRIQAWARAVVARRRYRVVYSKHFAAAQYFKVEEHKETLSKDTRQAD